MTKVCFWFLLASILPFSVSNAQERLEKDLVKTSAGELGITFLGHGSLMFTFQGKTIYVDPYSKVADYTQLPEADVVLITHHHGDHLDAAALEKVRGDKSVVVLTAKCAEQVQGGVVLNNGEAKTVEGLRVEAVPAYNLVHKRDNGQLFHPKGEGNGYVIVFGDQRVYVAGDTENTPEMKALEKIDIAFLPMNLPYTMTPEMVADAAVGFRPKVLYPYHTGETDLSRLLELLKDHKEIEVRIRDMK